MPRAARLLTTSLRAAAVATVVALTAAAAAQAASIHSSGAAAPHRATAVTSQSQASITFTTLDNSGDPTLNELLSINNQGVIGGFYGNGQAGHPNTAYTIVPPYTQFGPANLPLSVQTQLTSIIDGGTAAGFWSPTNNGTGNDANFGFIRYVNNGVTLYLTVNDPLASSFPQVDQVRGINASLNAVGVYDDANNEPHGFMYAVKTGKFTPVVPPGAVSEAATGINSNNLVCGYYTNGVGHVKGFLLSLVTGKSVNVQVPSSEFTEFLGVNAAGVAVGFTVLAGGFPQGVMYSSATGKTTILNDPEGTYGTTITGINDEGEAVGYYIDAAGNRHGMIILGL